MKVIKKFLSQRAAKIAAIVELRTSKTRLKKIYDNVPKGEVDQIIWCASLLVAIRTIDTQIRNIKSSIIS